MEPTKSEIGYGNLIHVITALSFWSKESMQRLLESGIASDLKEAAESKSFCPKNAVRFVFDDFCDAPPASLCCQSEVTLPQAKKLMEIAPKNYGDWINFFRLVSAFGQRSGRFSTHGFTRVSCVDAGMPHGVSLWDERATHTLGVSKQRSCLKP
ncbi:hypothetical protein K9M47_03645 [Candidatus Gracilibacteria bacterium]|nr:hypothetical protein [Candidatus Gracilibacteria bacterium]MCF7898902.1 hypothetical protein [Candidatus Paceibacterota bacterium]